VAVADVSGKGMPGAILWANLQATLRSQAPALDRDLPRLIEVMNRLFFAATAPEHFATLFLGVYDEATRRLRYVNCGHNAPLLARAGGGSEALTSTAPALGLIERWTAQEAEIEFQPGDTLLIYSDGVTEARRQDASDASPGGGEFGEARLLECLLSRRFEALAELPARLLSEVEDFAGPEPQDDRTIVAIRALR
jgi:sigma-B regulation protein RsbU (phosphoserine phosphatase)